MEKHYNLYYIFEEDKKRNPLSDETDKRIRKKIKKFSKKIKPKSKNEPLINKGEKKEDEVDST